ncbi:MAG: hypothetical protein ACXAAH_10970, partial [Promethearchaeota archaeon]
MNSKKKKTIIILFSLALVNLYVFFLLDDNNNTYERNNQNKPNISFIPPFQLTEEFEPSTYYISPFSSPGANDHVFFSFEANRKGNYTLNIKNFPSFITESSVSEGFLSFDNPTGSNIWLLSYIEADKDNFGDMYVKVSRSQDEGKHWQHRTIATFQTDTDDIFMKLSYLKGTAIAANVNKSMVGVITWVNWTDLVYIGSTDNGETWNSPVKISNSSILDNEIRFDIDGYPEIEVGILKNGTIFAISEIGDDPFRNFAYLQSDDNGTTWSDPTNITIASAFQCTKPKLQVDHNSGKYWLMWHTDEPSQYLRWAEFQPTETLSSNVPNQRVKNVILEGNFDFFFDGNLNVLRMIRITGVEMEIWNTTSYGTPWTNTTIDYIGELSSLSNLGDNLGLGHDGQTFRVFFTESFSGSDDIYQYTYFPSPIFKTWQGLFNPDQVVQIFWDGRMQGGTSIPISRVFVEFTAQNDTTTIESRLYLTIDNQNPDFDKFNQQQQFFNPLSSNITLSNLPWEILASEPCTAYVQIFRENNQLSSSNQITDNNWQDSRPFIFISDRGVVFILYKTLESGRNLLYLIKSLDKGITWSSPVQVVQSNTELRDFHGAAWGSIVVVYVKSGNSHQLFRSFDFGESYQPPVILSDQPDIDPAKMNLIPKILFTKNGTMFLTFASHADRTFNVLKSTNLGLNWSVSKSWGIPPANIFQSLLNPDIIFDRNNRLLHVVLPFGNLTELNPQLRNSNYSFVTLDFNTGTWGNVKSPGLFQTGLQFFHFFGPKFMLYRESPFAPLTVKAIFINDIAGETGIEPIYYEINSTNLGNTWSKPQLIPSLNFSAFASEIIETYYVQQISDGFDDELYIKREGRLVRSMQKSVSSTETTELTFDGIDDFGNYLPAGNYSYNVRLRDSAGNEEFQGGWIYIDYDDPDISSPNLNWTYPTPRLDVEVSAIIQDETNITAYLYYKKDSSDWESFAMTDLGGGNYSSLISGDEDTERILYYIKAVDQAGNVFIENDGGANFIYEMPRYTYINIYLFNESLSYSSSQDYELSINITDYEYIESVIFSYSTDGGITWIEISLVS